MRTMRKLSKSLFILSAVLAAAASFCIALAPLTISSQTAQFDGGDQILIETTHQASWFSVQGVWGILVLLLFTMIFAVGAFASIRGWLTLLAAASLFGIALTYLSGFSIGMFYLPSAAAVILGWVIMALRFLRDLARK
jgi:hypothetical protein